MMTTNIGIKYATLASTCLGLTTIKFKIVVVEQPVAKMQRVEK